jgi:hypothetical protein
VAQRVLDEAQRYAGREPRGRRAVLQRVARSALLDTAVGAGGPEGILHTVARPRRGGRRHAATTPSWGRKNPARMAVGSPVLAEALQGAPGQGDRTVCGAGAPAHVHEPSCTINSKD